MGSWGAALDSGHAAISMIGYPAYDILKSGLDRAPVLRDGAVGYTRLPCYESD